MTTLYLSGDNSTSGDDSLPLWRRLGDDSLPLWRRLSTSLETTLYLSRDDSALNEPYEPTSNDQLKKKNQIVASVFHGGEHEAS